MDAGLSLWFTAFDSDGQPRNGTWGEVFRTMRVSTAIPFIQSAMTGTGMRRLLLFNDGGVHVLANTVEQTGIRVEDSAGPGGQPTTLTFGT